MKVLVSGGGGFIGSHVSKRLLSLGADVRVIDNFSTGRRENLSQIADCIDLFDADIRDPAAVSQAMDGCEAVFHIAAVPSVPRSIADPETTHTVGITGTLNMLMAARDEGVRRFVFASSSSVYGATKELPKRELLRPLPISPYAVSKLAGESYCRSFFEVYGLETVCLRYFNVFGPRQDPNSEYAAVVPKFIAAFSRGEAPVIHGDGEQSRDFTYVDNVVDANIAALDAPRVGGRIYNIACGDRTTLNELAALLRAQVGASVDPVHGPERPGDVRHSLADVSAAESELGYTPRVSLEDGLSLTVAHFVDELVPEPAAVSSNGHANNGNGRNSNGHVHLNGHVHTNGNGNGNGHVGLNGHARLTGKIHIPAVRLPARDGAGFRVPKRFLITGGSGFIGSHLAETLSERGDYVVILDDLSTGRVENIAHLVGENVRFIEGSVTDAALVDECMRDVDICVHLASAVGVQLIVDEPLDTLMRSVRGSNVVMHAASNHGVRVLFASTSEVYGKHSNGSLSEQDDLIFGSPSKGRWTYAIAKCFGEAIVHGYNAQRGVDATVVRLFNTVGPRQTGMYGMVLPRFVRQALAGEDITVYGNGEQTRCFTHVFDTVEAITLLCDHQDAPGNAYNIGSSTQVSVLELARRVIERTGSDSQIVHVPYHEAYGDGFEELGTRTPDTTALRRLTGWTPRQTLDAAIEDVITYERSREVFSEPSVASDAA